MFRPCPEGMANSGPNMAIVETLFDMLLWKTRILEQIKCLKDSAMNESAIIKRIAMVCCMYIFFKNDKAGEEMFKNLVVNYLKTRLKVTRDKTEKEEEK